MSMTSNQAAPPYSLIMSVLALLVNSLIIIPLDLH